MANNKVKTASDRDKKTAKRDSAKKGGKPSIFARLKKWFVNIISELKRVMWPDRKKLKQSTLTVLLIIAIATVLILVFDSLISFILRTSGFYTAKQTPSGTTAGTTVSDTITPGETTDPSGTTDESSSPTPTTTGQSAGA